jgi:hypothetical protein
VKGNSPGFGGGLLLSTKKWAAGYSYDITNKQNYLSIYFFNYQRQNRELIGLFSRLFVVAPAPAGAF